MNPPVPPRRPGDARRREKLRWRCRRGMKELDLLLERFLERGFDDLSEHQLSHFEALLARPDQDLLAWISGGSDPDDAELADLARRVRTRIGLHPGLPPRTPAGERRRPRPGSR